MSILNLYKKDGFTVFIDRLFSGVSSSKKLTLQSLQHQIAIALGARSLEAYHAEIKKTAQTKPYGLFQCEPYVLVKRYKFPHHLNASSKEKVRYLHRNSAYGTFDAGINSNVMLLSEFHVRRYFLPHETTKFPCDLPHGVVGLRSEERNSKFYDVVSLLMTDIGYYHEVTPLKDVCPVLYVFLNAGTQAEIEQLLSEQPGQSLDIDGLSRACWSGEVERDDTSLGYVEWLSHQLECCRDDFHHEMAASRSPNVRTQAGFSQFAYHLFQLMNDEKEVDQLLNTEPPQAQTKETLTRIVSYALDGFYPVPVKYRPHLRRLSHIEDPEILESSDGKPVVLYTNKMVQTRNEDNLKVIPFTK